MNNSILIILSVLIFILYAKWIFCAMFYPLMAFSAMGHRVSNRKVAFVLCFPLRVAEHFLRFGGVDMSCSR